ncbi:MAG: 2-succinyl-6-hydroxy-2,4-cyclohexadiene-1-carboxylate synthase [Ignavibacterium sp.]|nr:2-succinyl-6-hydroxy-2,4-cyclohexadiene-1-carboxylate synthase [Ignavibacterium sp.]MCX7611889.1 2-succinyl-6-hydroxy-2,4-cyclohexadiene-1-carboxylate synthase [Ignavibacterium sp.]MDW8375413.1 2-succinyl-6-hydroxy-2,4-cyclohexadiene-1-carboxylate synthase [Ignavibacteriales bacterium]
MFIDFNGIKLNVEIPKEFKCDKDSIILIHGFTGCSEDWLPIIDLLPEHFNFILMDMIGHGKSEHPLTVDFYKTDSIVEQIKTIKEKIVKNSKVILLGYSMGGRAALSYAVKYPDDIKGLILESASAGIKNDKERKKRYEDDLKIVDYISSHTIEEFIEFWYDQEMFNTQRRFSNEKLKRLKKQKYNNSKIGLMNILRGFSTGIMPPLHDKLKNIKVRSVLISGELDTKYTFINSKIARGFHKAKHKVVKNSGHNTHLEEPTRFVEIVTNYLNQISQVKV